jgi:hypothetical protein
MDYEWENEKGSDRTIISRKFPARINDGYIKHSTHLGFELNTFELRVI